MEKVQAQVLRDTVACLQSSFEDAFHFVEKCPHKRLWTILGDHALIGKDFQNAIKAFVRLNDYNRIQYTKQVWRSSPGDDVKSLNNAANVSRSNDCTTRRRRKRRFQLILAIMRRQSPFIKSREG